MLTVGIRWYLTGFLLGHQLSSLYTPHGDLLYHLCVATRHMLIIPKSEFHSPDFSLGFRHIQLVITADRVPSLSNWHIPKLSLFF